MTRDNEREPASVVVDFVPPKGTLRLGREGEPLAPVEGVVGFSLRFYSDTAGECAYCTTLGPLWEAQIQAGLVHLCKACFEQHFNWADMANALPDDIIETVNDDR